MLELGKGLKYPWGQPKRLWNILWVLLPIFGWFALIGYQKRIINSIVKGNTKAIPEFGPFWDNFVTGIMIFLKMIPIMIILVLLYIVPFIGKFAYYIFAIFFVPWLSINLMQKYTVASTFEFENAAKIVFGNFVDYIVVILKSLLYAIIYGILIIVLVGIPCSAFGKNLFMAEFYAKAKKK